jgi:DNA (cytosine-5)-methyltransferase 1
MGWQNVFHCEISDFCQKILKYHFPNSTSYNDIKKTDFTIHRGSVDILTGGFPCQGFSLAGLRLGTDDDRYLWPEYLRVIDETNPTWIVGENVTGIISMEDKSGVYRDVFAQVENRKITRFREVDYYEAIYTRQAKMLINSICESLEERGYEVQPFAIPAAGVEAPHIRERVWFVAHSKGERSNRKERDVCKENGRPDGKLLPVIEQPSDGLKTKGTTTDPNRDGLKSRRPRKDRPAPGQGQSNIKERKRVRDDGGRNGEPGYVTDTSSIGRQKIGRQEIDNKERDTDVNISKDKQQVRSSTPSTGKKRNATNTGRSRCEKLNAPDFAAKSGHSTGPLTTDWRKWPTQPPVCTGDDGFRAGLDGLTFSKWRNESLKAGGNAVVPNLVLEIFKTISQYQNEQL